MEKKLAIVFKIITILFCVFFAIKLSIPEWKENYKNDMILWTRQYQNIIEWKIDDSFDSIFVLNKQGKIYKVLPLTASACILKEQELENITSSEALDILFPLLIRNNIINKDSKYQLIRNNEKFYKDFKEEFTHKLNRYFLNNTFTEKKETLQDFAKRFSISFKNDKLILIGIHFYSENAIESCSIQSVDDLETYSWELVRSWSDNIYQKISSYVKSKNLSNFTKEETPIPLMQIPADEEGLHYPTKNSWYYAKDGIIYAYIEFRDEKGSYDYCYQGSISKVEKGLCS